VPLLLFNPLWGGGVGGGGGGEIDKEEFTLCCRELVEFAGAPHQPLNH
jgi:hypothetical protein